MVARSSAHAPDRMMIHHEAECRADAVAGILAAVVLGHLERDEVLDLELARLAEQAHRHLTFAGEAA